MSVRNVTPIFFHNSVGGTYLGASGKGTAHSLWYPHKTQCEAPPWGPSDGLIRATVLTSAGTSPQATQTSWNYGQLLSQKDFKKRGKAFINLFPFPTITGGSNISEDDQNKTEKFYLSIHRILHTYKDMLLSLQSSNWKSKRGMIATM